MDILVIVNASPWGTSLPGAAYRFVTAALDLEQRVPAVFFHDDGVYNAVAGRMADDGLPAPQAQWAALARDNGIDLLLCSAAAARRMPEALAADLEKPFREAGLAEMLELMDGCDRVVTF